MYRVIFKDDYKTVKDEFIKLLKSFKSLYTYSKLDIFKNQQYIYYKVYCNEENNLEFYFDIYDNEKNKMLYDLLQVCFKNEIADVIETDCEFNDEVFSNGFYKYKDSVDYRISKFDHNTTNYILSALKPNTSIDVKLYVDKNDQYKIDLKLKGYNGCQSSDIKSISSVIQQITVRDKSQKGRGIKLHVEYDCKNDNYMKVTKSELLNFLFIPYDINKIITTDIYSSFLEDDTLSEGVAVGNATHFLQKKREVKIPWETLRRHLFCTGQTGAGKSSVLETQIYSILRSKAAGNDTLGFTLIDPKLGACVGVMNAIDKLYADGVIKNKDEFMEKVKYIDLKNKNCNFGINILSKDVEADELIDYFKSVFSSSGVQIERYIMHTVNLLKLDKHEHHIKDILRLLEDDDYRLSMVQRVIRKHGEDKSILFSSMLQEEIKRDHIEPIISRISAFSSNEQYLRIFSGKDDLNIKKWIEEGYIILFNFDSFSAPDVKMIGGYIATKYYQVGLEREEGSHSHYLIIDEAHDVQVPVLEKIIAKLRSRGLHLWLYTQYLEQFEQKLLAAITSNMSSKLILQQGTKSSKQASDIVKISKDRIEEMPKQHLYCVTETAKGEIVRAFLKANPPFRYSLDGILLQYSSSNEEEDQKLKLAIQRRNSELVKELEDNMLTNYPLKETANVSKVDDSNNNKKLDSFESAFI